jgi:integrative and conjugative element protein (TIGR02256 family)
MVAVHAGIGARAVRQTLTANQAQAAVWRTNSESLEVHRVELRPWEALEQDSGGCSICTDQWLLAAVHQARREKLPSETGGVLIGAVDMQRHVIYVVDMLPSPVDSIEWPTVYIRGYQDLATEIDRVRKVTAGALGYVGEWHSHPHGHTPAASAADRRALTLLARELAFEGLPALMLIVADHGGYQWYVLRES